MDAKQIFGLLSGTVAFVAVVALGAFAVVSLSPDERRVPVVGQPGLLIEDVKPLRSFDAPAPRVPAITDAPAQGGLTALHEPEAALRPAPPSPTPPESRPPKAEPAELPVTNARVRQAPAEPPRPEPKAPRPVAPSFQAALSSVPPVTPPRTEGVLTPGEIRRMRLTLRLTREQESFWPPVEQALLEIGAQQSALVRAGQDPKDALGASAGMRIYGVARPFLDQLREDQKAQLRARARALGFGAIASAI